MLCALHWVYTTGRGKTHFLNVGKAIYRVTLSIATAFVLSDSRLLMGTRGRGTGRQFGFQIEERGHSRVSLAGHVVEGRITIKKMLRTMREPSSHLQLSVVNEGRPELTQSREAHVRVANQRWPILVDIRGTRCDDREAVAPSRKSITVRLVWKKVLVCRAGQNGN